MGKIGKNTQVKTLVAYFDKIYANQNGHTRGNLIVKRREIQACTVKKAQLFLMNNNTHDNDVDMTSFSMNLVDNHVEKSNKNFETKEISHAELPNENSESIDLFKMELLEKSNAFIEKNRLKFLNEVNYHRNQNVIINDNLEACRLIYFKKCLKQIEIKLSPIIAKSILGYDVALKLSNIPDQPKTNERHNINTFTEKLNEIIRNLEFRGADSLVLNNLVKQIFHLIDVHTFNNLILRKKLCNRSKGVELRNNIETLEKWLQINGFENSDAHLELAPIKQAIHLLNDHSNKDIKQICVLCSALTIRQIKHILSMYTTTYGRNLSTDFIINCVTALKEYRSNNVNSDQQILELDINKKLPISIPINERYVNILMQLCDEKN